MKYELEGREITEEEFDAMIPKQPTLDEKLLILNEAIRQHMQLFDPEQKSLASIKMILYDILVGEGYSDDDLKEFGSKFRQTAAICGCIGN